MKIKDIVIGETYNNFTVLEKMIDTTNKPGYVNSTLFKVICNRCNNILSVRPVRIGRTRSCMKCLTKVRTKIYGGVTDKEQYIRMVYHHAYSKLIVRSRTNKIPLELSEDQFIKIISQNCYYCGQKPNQQVKQYKNFDVFFNGIDRIDSSKGYTMENSRPSCGMCNVMKLDHTEEEWLLKIEQIYNFQRNKNSAANTGTTQGSPEPIQTSFC